jgi:SUMO ligase MMS21 Smc5/6 complex component
LRQHDRDLQHFFNFLDYPTLDKHLTLDDIKTRFFSLIMPLTTTNATATKNTNSTISLLTASNTIKREKTPVASQRTNGGGYSGSNAGGADMETKIF